ncbi:hypothetical protein [Lentilactobacillus senioris]|uniref:hypothetical protein n=1 Tax=Lentilactobacillus senioris TaxID=931534 RepID=UPI003D2C3519
MVYRMVILSIVLMFGNALGWWNLTMLAIMAPVIIGLVFNAVMYGVLFIHNLIKTMHDDQ